jgi:alanine racemase
VIGIVPVGYADGIPPAAGATDQRCGASIRVHPPQSVASGEGRGAAAAIVGAVSMDQIAVDLGALRGRADSFVGRGVEIIETAHNGPHSLRGFAQACGLTPHQLLVGIGPRVPRVSVSRPLVEQPSEAWQAAAV